MNYEIKSSIEINEIEFSVRIQFDYTPYCPGGLDEPPTPESFDINQFDILSEDENGHEVTIGANYLLMDSDFEESIVELIKQAKNGY